MLITILKLPRSFDVEEMIEEAKGFSAHVTMNRSIPDGYGPFFEFNVNCKDQERLATVALTIAHVTMFIDRSTDIEACFKIWQVQKGRKSLLGAHPLYCEN